MQAAGTEPPAPAAGEPPASSTVPPAAQAPPPEAPAVKKRLTRTVVSKARTAEAAPPIAPSVPEAPLAERKLREYRYRTRILKAMILPLLFSLMSFWMLYSYVTGYEPYFSYHFEIIISGFILGLLVTSGLVIFYMTRAKRSGSYPARQLYGIILILVFLVPYLYLMLFIAPADAWRFSLGYFLSAMLSPLAVIIFESYANGKFYVQEEEVDNRLTRTLVFKP